MNSRSSARWIVLLLVAVGCAAIGTRIATKSSEHVLAGESKWTLVYQASFLARKAGAELHAAFPRDTHHTRVEGDPVITTDLERVANRLPKALAKHELVLRSNKTGPLECKIEFTIRVNKQGALAVDTTEAPISAHDHGAYIQKESGIPVDDPIVAETLTHLRDDMPGQEELIDRIYDYCRKEIALGGAAATEDGGRALQSSRGSPLGQVRAFAALCRAAKLPTRIVTGFKIESGADVQPRHWAEVQTGAPGARWEQFDLEDGFKRELSEFFLPVQRNNPELFRLVNASDLLTRFSITKKTLPESEASYLPLWLDILNLQAMPAILQNPIAVILLLPFGGLFTAFVRTIVGIRTFGTFTPTLLALAFVFNDWKSGLIVALAVMVVGLVSRTFLDRLKLLLVPRLAIILTIVVVVMVFCVSAENYASTQKLLNWSAPADRAVLLPMVILTNLVERFFVAAEEDNLHSSIKLLGATMAMSFVIFLLLNSDYLKAKVLAFPEVHFFTVATLIAMGRYTGYRWSELIRFRDLAQSPTTPEA